jgi:hypothetical protein
MVRKVVYLLVVCHLTLVAGAVTHKVDGLIYRSWWEKPLLLYTALSYSVWRFGFFAPDVGKSTEVDITVHRQDGSSQRYTTLDGFRFFTTNHESANRFYVFKLRSVREKPLRDLAARSVATRMLNMDPDGVAVDYALRTIRYPTMSDFRRGAPVDHVELYSTTFGLRGAMGKP